MCFIYYYYSPSVVRVKRENQQLSAWAAYPYSVTMSSFSGTWSRRWIKNGLNAEIMRAIKPRLLGVPKAGGNLTWLLTVNFHRWEGWCPCLYISTNPTSLGRVCFEVYNFLGFRKKTWHSHHLLDNTRRGQEWHLVPKAIIPQWDSLLLQVFRCQLDHYSTGMT